MRTLFKQKASAFFLHLFISILIIGLFFVLIFFIWYPPPYHYVEGVERGLIILSGAYFILGPILTLILYKPGKKGLLSDIVLVILLQSGVFLYGAKIIYDERPAYISFSYDQFKTIQLKKVVATELQNHSLKSGIFSSPLLVTIKLPKDAEKLIQMISKSSQEGRNVFEMAQYYQPFDKNFVSATKNTSGIPLKNLFKNHPEQVKNMNKIKQNYHLGNDDLMLLPVQGSKNDVIVIINKSTGRVIDYLLISPWI